MLKFHAGDMCIRLFEEFTYRYVVLSLSVGTMLAVKRGITIVISN